MQSTIFALREPGWRPSLVRVLECRSFVWIVDVKPGMMMLISLATGVAYLASLATIFGWLELDSWWELALLIDVMLVGHWLEMRTIGQARGALPALAIVMTESHPHTLPIEVKDVPVHSS